MQAKAFRDKDGDIWVQAQPYEDEYLCVTLDNFLATAADIIGLSSTPQAQIEKYFGPIREI